MSLRALLAVLVIVFAILALFAHLALDPWWGVLALAIVVAVTDFLPTARVG